MVIVLKLESWRFSEPIRADLRRVGHISRDERQARRWRDTARNRQQVGLVRTRIGLEVNYDVHMSHTIAFVPFLQMQDTDVPVGLRIRLRLSSYAAHASYTLGTQHR